MKIRKLKKLLSIIFLGTIIPVIRVEGENNDNGESDSGNAGDSNDTGNNGNDSGDNNIDGQENNKADKTFTQAELDKLVTSRLNRERKNLQKEFDEKQKREKMSEEERLKAEKQDAENKATKAIETANNKLIKAEIVMQSAKLNIIDSEAAYALVDKSDINIDDEGNVKGAKEALESLVKNKAYLIKQQVNQGVGDDQSAGKQESNNNSFNDILRRYAGYQKS